MVMLLMTSHFMLMLLFALFVSLVFAVLMRDVPREQLHLGTMLFAGFVVTAVIIRWLMYPLPL